MKESEKPSEDLGVEGMLGDLRKQIAECLPEIESLEKKEIAFKLLIYEAVFATNFVPWMTNTWVRCQSDKAREVCVDNLLCEIKEDHPAMLRNFVSVAEQHAGDVKIEEVTESIRRIISRLTDLSRSPDAMNGLLIMAALENTSLEFIPWMEKAAMKLGATDLEYTKKHGMADIEHANEFVVAVKSEAEHLGVLSDQLTQSNSLKLVSDLLQEIFSAK